jgi:hypothetical protein
MNPAWFPGWNEVTAKRVPVPFIALDLQKRAQYSASGFMIDVGTQLVIVQRSEIGRCRSTPPEDTALSSIPIRR